MTLPTLVAARLKLRAFRRGDVDDVWRLAGARELAQYTLHIPHPYERQMAMTWIASHGAKYRAGEAVTLAVTRCADGALLGAMGLTIDDANRVAEMGYWIGVPYWGRGYATEAGSVLVDYGFRQLGLQRIHAAHLAPNLASGRVMQKLGMVYEGTLRQHVLKWGIRYDLVLYGLLRSDYLECMSGNERELRNDERGKREQTGN